MATKKSLVTRVLKNLDKFSCAIESTYNPSIEDKVNHMTCRELQAAINLANQTKVNEISATVPDLTPAISIMESVVSYLDNNNVDKEIAADLLFKISELHYLEELLVMLTGIASNNSQIQSSFIEKMVFVKNERAEETSLYLQKFVDTFQNTEPLNEGGTCEGCQAQYSNPMRLAEHKDECEAYAEYLRGVNSSDKCLDPVVDSITYDSQKEVIDNDGPVNKPVFHEDIVQDKKPKKLKRSDLIEILLSNWSFYKKVIKTYCKDNDIEFLKKDFSLLSKKDLKKIIKVQG